MTIGSKIYRTQSCSNSMQWAKDESLHAPDGSVFIPETLTYARGRQGRTWQLAPGQLPLTILLKPEQFHTLEPSDYALRLNQLTMALALGIRAPLEKYGTALKWPNDFVINDKKIGGMLSELIWHAHKPTALVLGFALNVNNHFASDDHLFDRATSIITVSKQITDLEDLTNELFASLNYWYNIWQTEKYDLIFTQWLQYQCFIGRKIYVHEQQGTRVSGIATTILPTGDLVLQNDTGDTQTIPFYSVQEVHTSLN